MNVLFEAQKLAKKRKVELHSEQERQKNKNQKLYAVIKKIRNKLWKALESIRQSPDFGLRGAVRKSVTSFEISKDIRLRIYIYYKKILNRQDFLTVTIEEELTCDNIKISIKNYQEGFKGLPTIYTALQTATNKNLDDLVTKIVADIIDALADEMIRIEAECK